MAMKSLLTGPAVIQYLATTVISRWIQKNLSTGKQIPILMPWELIKNRITKAQTFNDLSEAYRNFKGES